MALLPDLRRPGFIIPHNWRGVSAALDQILDHILPTPYLEGFYRPKTGRAITRSLIAKGMIPSVLMSKGAYYDIPIYVRHSDVHSIHIREGFSDKQYQLVLPDECLYVTPTILQFDNPTYTPKHIQFHRDEGRHHPDPLPEELEVAKRKILRILHKQVIDPDSLLSYAAGEDAFNPDNFEAESLEGAKLPSVDELRKLINDI